MSFLTAEKKDHVARCPAGEGGGQTYLGNARLKTFFLWTPSLMHPLQREKFPYWQNQKGGQNGFGFVLKLDSRHQSH